MIDYSLLTTVYDALGIRRCEECGGIVYEDYPGTAMKYLGIDDCGCARCWECRELREDSERVQAGMKCEECAGYGS